MKIARMLRIKQIRLRNRLSFVIGSLKTLNFWKRCLGHGPLSASEQRENEFTFGKVKEKRPQEETIFILNLK